jgi:hypothetical protein
VRGGGQNLVAQDLNTNVADVHRILPWPCDTELLHPTIRALVFERVGTLLLDNFFPYDELDNQPLRRFGHMDHRKYLTIQSWAIEENVCLTGSTFGFGCIIKRVQGTILCSTAHQDMLTFDVDKFRKVSSSSTLFQRYVSTSPVGYFET